MKLSIFCASMICIVTFLSGLPASAGAASVATDSKPAGSIAILAAPWPEADPRNLDPLMTGLKAAGFSGQLLTFEQALDEQVLRPSNYALYVIPNAQSYPAQGLDVLKEYVASGGRLMTIGGPAFHDPAFKQDGKWFTAERVRRTLLEIKPQHMLFAFDNAGELTGWYRTTNDAATPGTIRILKDALAAGGGCAAIQIRRLSGWDGWCSPKLENLFGPGQTLLCLRARGNASTPQMAVEIVEQDGSRWYTTVELTPQWRRIVLQPTDFQYWPDSPTRGSRGGSSDRFNPQNGRSMSFFLAPAQTPAVKPGAHGFLLDDIGTAANPFGPALSLPPSTPPIIETISPYYKVYELTDVAALKTSSGQTIVPEQIFPRVSQGGIAPQIRFAGRGFCDRVQWRFVPLVEALDKEGTSRGAAISLLVCNADSCKGAIVSNVGINDPSFLLDRSATAAIVQLAKRMTSGHLLLQGGSEFFSYRQGQTVRLGAEVFKVSGGDSTVTVRMTVGTQEKGIARAPVFTQQATVTVSGPLARTSFEWKPLRLDPSGYTVTTELLENGQVVDIISHELGVLPENKPAQDEFITARDGNFWLKGAKWYPVGINYWPNSVLGLQTDDYIRSWLSPGNYDPQQIEHDLLQMEQLGINMVSIQMGDLEQIPNLQDFLRRCRNHQIRVNGFIEGAAPFQAAQFGSDSSRVRNWFTAGGFAENPIIFAYDTAWEPGNYVFSASWRPRWDRDWENWIVERYGSVESAEKDWGIPIPRKDGKPTSPSDQQFSQDGNWRIMVAAYRRFMDDLMSQKWNQATRRLRQLAPRQLISFRQGNTLPHDFTFTATAKHIDFICPEGYSIPNSEDGYNAAGFITRYVRFTTGGKPVIWAEFGNSVWNRTTLRPDPRVIEDQGRYHEIFYRVILEAGANGSAPWWWPGGYRVNELSDYGICNPDGTLRPAAELIRKYAPQIKAERPLAKGDYPFLMDRDANSGGYWYAAFNTGKSAYASAAAQGKMLVVKSRGTGTTSVDTPLTAVGNTPCNGHNPPKYLNAEFNVFRVQDSQGRWVDVHNGDTVKVTPDKPVMASASVGNLQEAKWVSPKLAPFREGMVFLASTETSQLKVEVPIASDTPYLGDAEFAPFELAKTIRQKTQVQLRMTAKNLAAFGEILTFTLEP